MVLKSQQFVDSNGGLGNKCSLGLKERMGAKGPELLVGSRPQFDSLDTQINSCVKEDDCLSEWAVRRDRRRKTIIRHLEYEADWERAAYYNLYLQI